MNLFDLLFGRRLANHEGMQRKIGWFAGVPAMGFAIGAFLTFTISQAGMIVHWRKQRLRHSGRLAINAAGALMTVVALAMIVAAKFADRGWIAIAAIPLLVLLMSTIHRRPRRQDRRRYARPVRRDHHPRAGPAALVAALAPRPPRRAAASGPDGARRAAPDDRHSPLGRLNPRFRPDLSAHPRACYGPLPYRSLWQWVRFRQFTGSSSR
jgi:hypothetical protein